MPSQSPTEMALLAENAALRARLEEAEDTLRSIQNGEVDALVVQGQTGPQIYTLQGMDADLNRFRGEILERVSEVIIVLDDNQHIVYLNGAAEQQYGVRSFAVLGCHVNTVYQNHWLQPGDEAGMKAALSETGYWCGESIHIKANGETLHTESRIARINDSNIMQSGELVVVRDITERKRIESIIHQTDERLQFALKISQIGAWELDLEDGTSYRSIEHDNIFGYDHLLPQWTYESFMEHVLSEDREEVDAKYNLAIATQGDWNFECRIRRIDGEIRWIWAAGRHYVNTDSSHKRMAGIVQDITERKRNEATLRDADQRKNEFLAMLGHELRSPLTPIANVAEILSMPPHDERKISVAGGILGRNVSHMTRLIDDLLDVSRITQGVVNIQRERVELGRLLKESAESVHRLIEEKNQTLNLKLPDQPLYLEGDPVRLTQVFTNLLNNASKYTDAEGCITLAASTEGPSIVVRVHDNGMGIEASLLPHIFDLFVQSQRGLARSEGGLGLGLTLVKRLVELHGGQITASSPGVKLGSEFVLTFPSLLEETTEPVPPLASQANAMAAEALKVLLIDDNLAVVESLTMAFDLWGYQVRAAHNGVDGICAARSFEPDVILLDIGLPDMDGYQVVKKLREQPALQSTLIIAHSGYAPDQGELSETGFDHYLLKPLKLGQLKELISEYQQAMQNPGS
jgi:PAS domain S-box-containing protein